MSDGHSRSCQSVLVTAPASGQGKTTVTAALARAWRERAPHASRHAASPRGCGVAEAIFRDGGLTASFVHWYFASNPAAAVGFFRG